MLFVDILSRSHFLGALEKPLQHFVPTRILFKVYVRAVYYCLEDRTYQMAYNISI